MSINPLGLIEFSLGNRHKPKYKVTNQTSFPVGYPPEEITDVFMTQSEYRFFVFQVMVIVGIMVFGLIILL